MYIILTFIYSSTYYLLFTCFLTEASLLYFLLSINHVSKENQNGKIVTQNKNHACDT